MGSFASVNLISANIMGFQGRKQETLGGIGNLGLRLDKRAIGEFCLNVFRNGQGKGTLHEVVGINGIHHRHVSAFFMYVKFPYPTHVLGWVVGQYNFLTHCVQSVELSRRTRR